LLDLYCLNEISNLNNDQPVGMENFAKAFLYAAIHTSVGAVAGSVIDPFFAFKQDESVPETVIWSGLHTFANGLAFSMVTKAVYPSDSITLSDPTGGAFMAFPFFIVQANYINRLRVLGAGLQNIVSNLIKNSVKEIAIQPTQAPSEAQAVSNLPDTRQRPVGFGMKR
jgi:hypothetical protein